MPVEAEIAPIDARAVCFDSLPDYVLIPGDEKYIKAIWDTWLYDKNSHTNCCELTPSYYLIHVSTSIEFNDAGANLSDDEKERIYSRYENEQTDDKYVHCHDIDAQEEKLKEKPFRYHVYGDPGVSFEDCPKDEQMDSIREHFRANAPF